MILADSEGRDVNKPCKHSKIWAEISKAMSPQETSYFPALMDIFFYASEQIAWQPVPKMRSCQEILNSHTMNTKFPIQVPVQ